ncbi:MAG: ATP/GTP-binding protein [Chitinivibrionales bacterium]|nr:ATP/GTP-binding protein [Chitinivibrionales bacterium]
MKHHNHNQNHAFISDPVAFNKNTEKDLLQYCLGGLLYMPGTKNVIDKILAKRPPAPSIVMCMEDAIKEEEIGLAEANIRNHLSDISRALQGGQVDIDDIPLIFLRVRSPEQFSTFSSTLTSCQASVLSGFVFPKFDSANGVEYLKCLEQVSKTTGAFLYGMPILEGETLALKESRAGELNRIRAMLAVYRERILNIRVGATDFSSIFGVRRGINYSIYDIMTIRDCLSDILNFFTRTGEEYVVSAPVWEYFLADKEESLDHLLEHDIHQSLLQRSSIVNEAIDGLLREVILDKANGFVGKTVIHPSHLKYVNAMQAVTEEEHEDALQVLNTTGGVVKSRNSNKMNEINPHRSWAKKIALRARAYGVIRNESAYLKLIFA